MATREQNEKTFRNWEEFPNGERRYWYEVLGKHGWKARYNKIVDSSEITLEFYQEIFDETGKRREIHRKYPVDLGHRTEESH